MDPTAQTSPPTGGPTSPRKRATRGKLILLLISAVCVFWCGFHLGRFFEHSSMLEVSWQNHALSQALFCIDRLSDGNAREEAMHRLHLYNQAASTNQHLKSFSSLTLDFVSDLLAIELKQHECVK
jgi:hypothetical protein